MKRHHRTVLLALFVPLLSAAQVHAAGWGERLKGVMDGLRTPAGGAAVGGLSQAEMHGGLKEALAVGAERAIAGLSRPGGYLDDPAVRIPLPGALEKTESVLRMMGQGAAVDEFVQTANRAAERAIPKAAPIVGNAIRAMTIADAQAILTGPDDAATRYFRDKTSGDLTDALMPIVRQATDAAGVTRAYKGMLGKAGAAGNLLGGSLDVDAYVTEKTLDGLFLKVAAEERRIRTDPVARSTELLKKVFGAAAR